MIASNKTPLVSVIIANYNGARFLKPLLKSLLQQSIVSLEIIVVDDASTDQSVQILMEAICKGAPIQLHVLGQNKGVGAARNVGLGFARGTWIAIVDSDDLLHPRRLEELINFAQNTGADIVVDDLLVFYEDGASPHRLLKGKRAKKPSRVTLPDFILANRIFSAGPVLGYLKPVFRRSSFERWALVYDESLRIGEDYDFVARALAHGLTLWINPFPSYLYRKHRMSVSHGLTQRDLEAMLAADERFLNHIKQCACKNELWSIKRAQKKRTRSIQTALAWDDFVRQFKSGQITKAGRLVISHPEVLACLRMPVTVRIQRLLRRVTKAFTPQTPDIKPSLCLISRQRLGAPTSGSAAYVLSIVKALSEAGHSVHLLQPSPSVFGRIPVLLWRAEARVFKTVRVRGGVKIGPITVSPSPKIWLDFARGGVVRVLTKLGLALKDKAAPYSVGAPWTADDLVFLAKHGPSLSDVVVFDYAFQTDTAAYIQRPDARTFVIMHDLISSRRSQFSALGQVDSMSSLSEAEELRLLSGADVVIAIQPEEAGFVRKRLPSQHVIEAPMAMPFAPAPQAGNDTDVLFVGTKTAPNVLGLNWFLDKVWPLVLCEVPSARLLVAGSVGALIKSGAPAVEKLGVVPDLGPLYQRAGVVVSPLQAGSGLKIKLVAALTQGKAIVATTPTLQGIPDRVCDAVICADKPEIFATSVVQLLTETALRTQKAEQAFAVAHEFFSPKICYSSLLDAVSASITRVNCDQHTFQGAEESFEESASVLR